MRFDDLRKVFTDIEPIWEREGLTSTAAAMRFTEEENLSAVVWFDDDGNVTGLRLMTEVGKGQLNYLTFVARLCKLLDNCFHMTLDQRNMALEDIGITDPKAPGGEYEDDRVKVKSSLRGSIYGVDVMWA